MAKRKKSAQSVETTGATVGYEAELWQMADALRGSMDAAEYKHVVLGLIFLKYISDAFEEQHAKLVDEQAEGADPEDPDEYRADNIFWVPPEARWSYIQAHARQSNIGKLIDDAMTAIERDNPALKGVLPRDYARPALDKMRLGQLIDLISNIQIGDEDSRAKDVLGRVYEYFLSQFASKEGKKGGEFYTPRCVVKLLVEMLEPYRGRVYDPCCGSAGMFVQSVEFIRAHATGNGNGSRRGRSQTRPFRDRRGEILFIDARKLGRMVDRTHRELTDEEIHRIARTYHAWRGEKDLSAGQAGVGEYRDIPGFCKSATIEEVRKHGYVLTPGRYVGVEPQAGDEPFEEKMKRLVAKLRQQQAEAARLDAAIWKNLKELGYDA